MASRKAQRHARRAQEASLQEKDLSPAPAVVGDETLVGAIEPAAAPAIALSVSDVPKAQVLKEKEEEESHEEVDQGQVSYIDPNDIKKGSYILLRENHVCKVVELNKSKPGKHGSAKTSVIALDVFSGKKYEEIFCTHKAEVPEVRKVELEVVALSDDSHLTLRKKDGTLHPRRVALETEEEADDDSVSAKIRSLLRAGKPVIVQLMQTMGREKVVMAREKVSSSR